MAETMQAIRDKVVFAFNQVLLGLIKDLRRNSDLHKIVGKKCKIFDKESDAYLTHFEASCDVLVAALPADTAAPGFSFASDEGARKVEPLRGVPLEAVFEHLTAAADRAVVDKYVLTLLSIALLSRDAKADDDDDAGCEEVGAMMGVLLEKLKDIEQNDSPDFSDVLSDELRRVLEVLANRSAAPVDGESAHTPVSEMMDDRADAAEEFFKRISNSKIGEIAKELSKSVDLEKIASDPKNLTNPGNLGAVIQSVTSTIQSKISNGSLNTEELFGEAMDMMKYFGGKTGAFGGANVNMAAVHNMDRKLKTKSRLREKLQQKQQKQTASA